MQQSGDAAFQGPPRLAGVKVKPVTQGQHLGGPPRLAGVKEDDDLLWDAPNCPPRYSGG